MGWLFDGGVGGNEVEDGMSDRFEGDMVAGGDILDGNLAEVFVVRGFKELDIVDGVVSQI